VEETLDMKDKEILSLVKSSDEIQFYRKGNLEKCRLNKKISASKIIESEEKVVLKLITYEGNNDLYYKISH
jgi:hypothetical protein